MRLGGGRRAVVKAVDRVSVNLDPGATLGLVGESGSGKSTTARLLLRLIDSTSGQIYLDGADITWTRRSELRHLRRRMQLVFQDPASSFDPHSTVEDSVGEGLRGKGYNRISRRARINELMTMVRLSSSIGRRHPRELSGGQLQRAAIARALGASPALIALDEPVSSLDVSSQVHILDLLDELQESLGLAYLLISHDLTVVSAVSNSIAVMYLGRVVEIGPASRVYQAPRHPYTQALLSAAPTIDPRTGSSDRIVLKGDLPSLLSPPSGCPFHTRCPRSIDRCSKQEPPVVTSEDGVTVSCHLYEGPPEPFKDSLAGGSP